MSTTVKIKQEDKCIGCEMCVMECQRQLKRVGLAGSYIRVLRNINAGSEFKISLDPKILELKSNKIVGSCPREVFEEVEGNGA